MADPFFTPTAAIVVASLCMPPHASERVAFVEAIQELRGERLLVAGGTVMPWGTLQVKIRMRYQLSPKEGVREISLEGDEPEIRRRVIELLNPTCVPVG